MIKLSSPLLAVMTVIGITASLAACSGSNSPPPAAAVVPPPPPPPVNTGPNYTPGVFEAASTFKNRCAMPRSGVDIEGNGFPDVAGTTTLENFWLRSWSNETYLWNTDIPDQNPGNFNTRLAYFAELRTREVTASGEDLDDFHFSQPTTEFLERRNSTARSGYGVRFDFISNTVPRELRILYTEPDSPAAAVVNGNVNFPRGAEILEIDGADLVNGTSQADIDTLNNGISPAMAGETHTFKVRNIGSSVIRDVTLVSENIAQAPVNRTSIINTPSGKVGYVLFNTFNPFSSEKALADTFTMFSNENIDDLVLDLRYNGGGLLTVAAQLAYMIAGDAQTQGRTFELLQFNAAAGNRNPVTGQIESPIPFINEGVGFSVAEGTPLDSVNLPRVFILSTGGTCSASEAVINGLDGIDVEIILIGDTTCGKPYGFYPQDNCGETYFTIQFRGINDKGFGDYSDGFSPQNSTFAFSEKLSGCVASDDRTKELGDTTEGLLQTALSYRETGQCPAITTKSEKPNLDFVAAGEGAMQLPQDDPLQSLFENNRNMTQPPGRQ